MKFGSIAACSAAAAATVLGLSTIAAVAAPAIATTNVNLRQGPGTTYPIVARIPGGAPIDVVGCNGQWCQAAFGGKTGYVIATALGQGGPPPDGPPPGYVPPPVVYVTPPAYYGGYCCGPYWGGGGWRGGGWGRRW
jgi:hypothetical protein